MDYSARARFIPADQDERQGAKGAKEEKREAGASSI
jgi:hypothetical protein